jgi:hypothetical protein
LSTATDSIFINETRIHTICPIVNGLSDRDAQEIHLDIAVLPKQNYTTRQHTNFNNYSIDEFLINLSYENWENVFNSNEASISFNNFLNTYLRIFISSFISKPIRFMHNNTPWITKGISVSCNHKKELSMLSREMKHTKLTLH